jgi:predicted regulator of Ras-like GTPase activity (Roadblock/LC7/MglB family)
VFEGELGAAVAIDDGSVIADPFHPTADLVALASMRATQLRAAGSKPLRLVVQTPSEPVPLRHAA